MADLYNTLAYLHTHGIDVEPERMEEMVQEAVSRLPRTLYRSDPRADLTPAEADALAQGGFSLAPADPGTGDPLARTAAEYAALLKSSLSTAQAAARLGVDPSRIRQRLTSRPPTLYGIRLDSGWVVPEFQLEAGGLIPGLAEVVPRLDPELHPLTVLRWFTTPHADLAPAAQGGQPLSPRDWLRLGLPAAPVAELAADL